MSDAKTESIERKATEIVESGRLCRSPAAARLTASSGTLYRPGANCGIS